MRCLRGVPGNPVWVSRGGHRTRCSSAPWSRLPTTCPCSRFWTVLCRKWWTSWWQCLLAMQIADDVPVLTLLDSPVPQMVDQLVAVLARYADCRRRARAHASGQSCAANGGPVGGSACSLCRLPTTCPCSRFWTVLCRKWWTSWWQCLLAMQIADDVPVLTLLDSPVPQMVDQLEAVLARYDMPLADQVIEVPKVSCPPSAVLVLFSVRRRRRNSW